MLSEIINGCGVFMVIVMIGCFAAGSCELAAERKERKRVQKLYRKNYPKVY